MNLHHDPALKTFKLGVRLLINQIKSSEENRRNIIYASAELYVVVCCCVCMSMYDNW